MDSLDSDIKILLHKKLAREMLRGETFETLEFHKRRLIEKLAEWIGTSYYSEDGNSLRRNHLLSLLVTASKYNSKEFPTNVSEWVKLLNKWIKTNSSGVVLSKRNIYKILAVDGFRGFKPKHLKLYLMDVLLPLRKEYIPHIRGVECMYDFIERKQHLSSFTGTDSACVIFLALIEWYAERIDSMMDDRIKVRVGQAKMWAEGHLQQHGAYYPDLKNVDGNVLKTLGKVYAEQFANDDEWQVVGRELMTSLNLDD